MALCLHLAARGQTGWTYEYWFDDDRTTIQTGISSDDSWQITADVSGLAESLHALHFQVLKDNAKPSSPITRYFVKTPEQATTTGRYWFDSDADNIYTASQTEGAMDIDVSMLTDGLHTLHYQVTGVHGGGSSLVSKFFVKIPQVEGVDYLTCLAIVDGQLFKQERVTPQGTLLDWDFDVASLPQGFHNLLVQVVTPSGAASATYQAYFIRETTHSEFAEMKCVYAIDGDEFDNVAGTLSDGTYHFDLDVSQLTDGLHRIAYMLSNGKGVNTKVQCQFFMKIPVGGYGITQYWYWLNDQDQNPTKVVLAERQDPLVLQQLLPVESVPIRSCLFQFSIKNDQPVIYAKNEFHARFYDVSGRFTDMTRQYVDERVSQTVTDTELLQNGVRSTTPRPAENTIKWYRLVAEAGDSLSFKLDRAATIQLFSPSGEEVHSASGAEAVNWSGLHVEENGTYYLALHDMTATNGTTISIDYEHIDRYAVLRQDITTVGNGGPSTITFQGNGFDKLQKVVLESSTTSDILHEALTVSSKATVSVKWNFAGLMPGKYSVKFIFNDGTEVYSSEGINVEEAVPVSVSSTVTYASLFLVSQGNTYNYKVKNNGNMTAYDIPMQLSVYATDPELLAQVFVDGTELTSFTTAETTPEGYVYGRCYVVTRSLRPNTSEPLAVKVKTTTTGGIFVDLDGVGGPSEAVVSLDPNDIYGYQDENGDKTIRNGLVDVYYTIEFENDPEFATAPAHDIYVTDVLSPDLFDLSTFAPTGIKIGDREEVLNGEKNGVFTFTMQPRINAIAQVEWTLNETTGEIVWHISSLNPLTMEPATYVLDGVLPVNTDGNGMGQLSFDIQLKPNLPIGTQIPNKATIVFDENDPIETPTWTNIIENSVVKGDVNNDGSVTAQDASLVLQLVAKKISKDTDGVAYEAADVNGDGDVTAQDASLILQYVAKKITW